MLLKRKRFDDADGVSATARRIGTRIRRSLDVEEVVRATARETQRVVRARRTVVWLTRGKRGDEPRPAAWSGAGPHTDTLLPIVTRASHRHRTVVAGLEDGPEVVVAMPMRAPQSGLVGVVTVEGTREIAIAKPLLEEITHEAALALQTASLYEQAVAGKEKSEAILSRVADAVVVTDARGRILDWNAAAERTFERHGATIIGTPCAAALGLAREGRPVDCSSGCPLLGTLAEHSVLGQEVARERSDGRGQPLLANVSRVVDANGAVTEVVHSFRDITRLKEADEAKTMFLATASHELRTPLTVIQGFAQLLSDSRYAGSGDRDQALAAIERRAAQLNRIVERLLLSSRIEAGKAELVLGEVAVEPILAERVGALRTTTRRSVRLALDHTLPKVVADPDALTTVVDHLLDNAIKYSPGGGEILVAARTVVDGIEVSIADHGIGMDAEQAARCFERFWQAESSDVRRFGGTGIGLYIVRSLVDGMGSAISVDAAPGAGSTFRFTLQTPQAARPDPARTVEPAPGLGEHSIVREFMRQIGIPERRTP